ncbi:acetate kinase [Psittacicella hinzii]|uniref:Acetate kinase n=1 Tax=Psittacicella hinzii TaxID=2028575 RepID=A0A3A1YUZ2_9GAMM|nr:acetate kinase [Psittacicella hinzii]RIY40650.1 acetate kinase [Psittacicella hinzii]
MKDLVLILNSGSSSIKFAIMNPESGEVFLSGLAEALCLPEARIKWKLDGQKGEQNLGAGAGHAEALNYVVENLLKAKPELLEGLVAIGHRVVHGGEKLTKSVLITDDVVAQIQEAAEYAPLHNPAALLGIKVATELFPALADKQVAVFDTAFHSTLPEEAYTYAIPYELYEKHGVRRYGMHGTSHKYITETLAKMIGKPVNEVNLINCHLGNGASICAVRNGESVETSMGFTPTEGLVMGTRSGDLDPGAIKYLFNKLNLTADSFDNLVNKQSGLLGITGVSSDCRYAEDNYYTDKRAKLALDVFAHRVAKYIGGYLAILNVDYIDAITFTGGIGENAPHVRKLVIDKLRLLGYQIDDQRNTDTKFGKEGVISKDNTPVIMVIPTNEELLIAQDTFALTRA